LFYKKGLNLILEVTGKMKFSLYFADLLLHLANK